MGILTQIKHAAPLFLYGLGILFALRALAGCGRWALLLAIGLIPLRNILDQLQVFPGGNQYLDYLLIAALIASLEASFQGRTLWAPSFFNVMIVVLVGYMFISLLIGNGYLHMPLGLNDRSKDLKNFCLMPLLYVLVAHQMTDQRWIKRVLMVMLLSLGLMIYYTVGQIHTYASLVSRDKISGTFQFLGPNEVAAFFSHITILLIAVMFFIKDKRLKWFLGLVVAANSYCILFLYSRGAYLAMMAGMLFLFFVKNRKMLIPIVVLSVFWQVMLPLKVIERIKQTENAYGQFDQSIQGRLVIWQQSMDLFQHSPWVGIGFAVFRHLGFILGDTHNIYLKILVEQGLIGLFIFLVIIFSFLRMGYVLYQKGEDDLSRGMGLGLMASVVVVLVSNFFGDRWTYMEVGAYLWVFAGLVRRLIETAGCVPSKEVVNTPYAQAPQDAFEGLTATKKETRYYDL